MSPPECLDDVVHPAPEPLGGLDEVGDGNLIPGGGDRGPEGLQVRVGNTV